jgi:hypothetical protein
MVHVQRIFAILLLGGTFSCLGPQAAAPVRRNVVRLLAGDLGWSGLGCTGATFYETPAVDRPASQRLRFIMTITYSARLQGKPNPTPLDPVAPPTSGG